MRLRYSLLGCLVLAACGGGGGGVVDPTGPQALVDQLNYSLVLVDRLDGLTRGPNQPDSGTPSFVGTMILANNPEGAGDTYTGNVALTADFNDPTPNMSGTAGGFHYFDTSGANGLIGDLVDGELVLTASSLQFGGATFQTAVTGDLEIDGVSRVASGSMTSDFAGNPFISGTDVQMVVGATDDTTGPISFGAGGNFEAVFIAEIP